METFGVQELFIQLIPPGAPATQVFPPYFPVVKCMSYIFPGAQCVNHVMSHVFAVQKYYEENVFMA